MQEEKLHALELSLTIGCKLEGMDCGAGCRNS